ncbi:CD97 antigen-like isoform X1 [Sinocyclocheilus grahami]|uniref:CD97 antigen-like isoform X1 n=1 Tax=Sinocyclocheilus grahami TaxID=75366 RepID=UPI0007AD155C|nr:PREDICTED: CD97 antigen-like isoform X1 [Sinocyclocheilus grahami]
MRHKHLLSLVLLLALTENILMQTPCVLGYVKRKGKCVDDDECVSQPSICGENARCFNTDGSYYCQCHEGFTPLSTHNFTQADSISCKDINECVDGSADCGPNAECVSSEGGYNCTCATGYISSNGKEIFNSGQGVQCIDINECVDGSADCGPNAECVSSEGGYNCTCATGYISSNGKEIFNSGQGVQCIDRDECNDPSFCGKHASCHNTAGGFYCICDAGFRLKSGETNFTDTSEQCESVCDVDKSICGGGVCKNSKDGHECLCSLGFTNYGHKQMKCTELKCDRLFRESKASQASPEFTKLVSLMTNSCLILNQSDSVSMKHFTQGDGERFLQAFLNALDDLLRGGFNGDNHIISALFSIVKSMLKLIGPQLSLNQTRRVSAETDVELLVKRGNSPPEGHFMMNTSGAQLTSSWDTATGNTYLGFTTAALLSYKGLEESLNGYFNHLETQQKQTFKINSKVVTATVSNKETDNLTKPVNLTFYHLEKKNEKHMCVFWDPELEGGAWSTRGCTTVRSSADQTVCSCSHLSSFAVLMALYDIGDVYELRLVTLVGLQLSLICLLICIVTFYFVRSIQSTRNTIHLHLCISLFIAYFVFLVGITRTENKVGCAVVAGILHYFFLASFCWMCLEGVQLFRMVMLVFNTTLRPIYMFATGYGVPAVIVAISATVNASGYGTDNYCWLNIPDGFIWSFYGPVCVIIIVNVLFFLITIWKLAEKFSSLNPDLDSLHKIKAFTVTAIAQLCILGIMWVFGCFQFNENTLPMSYIFTILSSLQGVLMFILHCWLSKQVREEYAKFLSCICAPHKRKYSEFTSNQTSKQQASRSDNHTGESRI